MFNSLTTTKTEKAESEARVAKALAELKAVAREAKERPAPQRQPKWQHTNSNFGMGF
jgi:hypothetical protein|tara:strand:+ start:338 stop:508 length:171 start_codon:yes stop_codon:yes gene_type:complete